MKVFESLFDIGYLSLVVALGLRLLLEKKNGAKLFGLMAIILGLGDSFHLLPRILAHLSPAGFDGYATFLSWGKFVTSITMTVFYVLYYFFYSRQSGDRDKKKLIAVFLLAAIRIIIVLLPQNNWDQAVENYAFGIYRNIPFAILGGFLIYWSYIEREKPGLKHMSLLIFLSFLFYAPVVLFSDKYPAVGALMMPKTVAYLLIVVFGYRFFVSEFSRINILGTALSFLFMGLIGGVFYRELTKFYAFDLPSHLGKIHPHLLVLGFLLLTLLYLVTKNYKENEIQDLKKSLYIYVTGLVFTAINIVLYGIFDVVGENNPSVNLAMLDGLSGLGHIVLAIGLVLLLKNIFSIERNKNLISQIETN